MFEHGSQRQIPQKITMKRVGNNMTEQQLGLSKAVPLFNGKQGVQRYGSMANVRLFYDAVIHSYLLTPDLAL